MVLQVNGDNNYIYSKIGELVGDAQEEIDEIVWRVDSKIKEVKRSASSNKKSLKFEYDPMGNRIAKYVYDGEMLESSTFYVRDAQGTTIAVYDERMITEVVNSTSITTVKYALAERHIYGSSRLGMDTTEVVVPQNEMVNAPTSETTIIRHLKKKLYELSNHLGNVLTVISDMKIPVGDPTTGVLEHYNPHIISVTDYSPFGVALAARTWSEQEYRFGFQAQEQDEEMWGGSVTYKYRVEDPRLGRFFAVDPLFAEYPWNSNYAFSENRLIDGIELEGLEYKPINDANGKTTGAEYVGYDKDGCPVAGSVTMVAWEETKVVDGKNVSFLTYTDCTEGYSTTSIQANSFGMVELPHSKTYTLMGNVYPAGEFYVGSLLVYNIFNYEGNDQFGSPKLIATMINMAIEYNYLTGGYINYGDISRPNGSTFSPHKSHKGGTQFDYRYAVGTKSGSRTPILFKSTSENIYYLQVFVNIAYKHGLKNFILPLDTMGKIKHPANGKTVDKSYPKKNGIPFFEVYWLFGAGHEDHGHAGY